MSATVIPTQTIIFTVSYWNSVSIIELESQDEEGNVVIVNVSTIVGAPFSVYLHLVDEFVVHVEVGSFFPKAVGDSPNRNIIIYTMIGSAALLNVPSAALRVYYYKTKPKESTNDDEDLCDKMASIHVKLFRKCGGSGGTFSRDNAITSTVVKANPLYNKEIFADFGDPFCNGIEEDTKTKGMTKTTILNEL
jgi:F0F1-type ATP synthase assembly protein I